MAIVEALIINQTKGRAFFNHVARITASRQVQDGCPAVKVRQFFASAIAFLGSDKTNTLQRVRQIRHRTATKCILRLGRGSLLMSSQGTSWRGFGRRCRRFCKHRRLCWCLLHICIVANCLQQGFVGLTRCRAGSNIGHWQKRKLRHTLVTLSTSFCSLTRYTEIDCSCVVVGHCLRMIRCHVRGILRKQCLTLHPPRQPAKASIFAACLN